MIREEGGEAAALAATVTVAASSVSFASHGLM